jgi:hypothetical protein
MANGGAIANAAPDGDDGGSASSSPGSTQQSGPVGSVSKALRSTIKGAVNALTPGHQAGPQSSVGSTGPSSTSPIAGVPRMLSDAIRIPTTITGLSGPRQNTTRPSDDPVTATSAAADPDLVTAQGDPGTAPNDPGQPVTPLAPVATALTSTVNQANAAINALVLPATGAVQSVVAPVTGVPSLVVPMADQLVTDLTAPIPDVLTSIQSMLTSATGAVAPMTQIPADFAALFGAAGVPPTGGRPNGITPWPSTAALTDSMPTVRPLAGERGVIGTDGTAEVTATPVSGATHAVAEASSVNANARSKPGDAISEGLRTFFHSYGALVIAASLSAMAAAALPGLIAFLVPTVAGVGVGYRQAKAALAVRASGIARFAGSGPIGIVRSGTFVALRSGARRPNALRGARSITKDAERSHLAA